MHEAAGSKADLAAAELMHDEVRPPDDPPGSAGTVCTWPCAASDTYTHRGASRTYTSATVSLTRAFKAGAEARPRRRGEEMGATKWGRGAGRRHVAA